MKIIPIKGAYVLPTLPDNEPKASQHSVKGKACRFLNLDIDAEWNSEPNRPNQFITLQARDTRTSHVSVLEHPSLGDGRLPSWAGLTPLAEILDGTEHRGILPINQDCLGKLRVRLSLFFSFGDVRAFFGGEGGHTVARTIQKLCDQKRRINHQGVIDIGDYYLKLSDDIWYKVVFEVEDNCGLMGLGGLKQYAAKVGLELTDKGLMDEYKSNMLAAYRNPELFEDYVNYAAGDCVSELLLKRFVAKLNSEIMPALGLCTETCDENGENVKGEQFDIDKMPRTVGAITESLLRRFIQRKILSDWEPGKRDNDVTHYNAQKHLYPVDYASTLSGVMDAKKEEDLYLSPDWILGQASVKSIMDGVNKNTTSIHNLLVQGGRCKNEKSKQYTVSGVIGDADISGCYGNGLMNQSYPIGLPTTLQHGFRQEKPSLRKVLNRWEQQFIPGLWQIVVDLDSLSFEQSLIFSKTIEDKALYRLVQKKYELEDPEVDVNFGLYTQQITNGIITHDVLQALRATMSEQEWSEFANSAKVKAGMFYLAKNQCENAKEWQTAVEKKPGKITASVTPEGGEVICDKRSRKWFSFSLSEFIGPLLSTRKALKTERSKYEKNTPEWVDLNAKQELFKLIVNTTYGVLASPYFSSGNAVVANNITARARVLAWAMSVACGGIQSITDGSAYDVNALRMRGVKFPGMDTLTKLNRGTVNKYTLRDCLKFVPLGGKSWEFVSASKGKITLKFGDELVQGSDGNWPLIDRLYKEHLQLFFEGRALDCLEQFDFEHKNIYASICFQSQSNYQFTTFEGELKTKARGHSLKKSRINLKGQAIEDPAILQLFRDLTGGHSRPYATEVTSGPLKVNAANEGSTVIDSNSLLAGDSVSKKMLIQSISLSGFMWPNVQLKRKWEKYNEFLKTKKGWGIDGCFYDEETGLIDYARAIVVIQEAIDAGLSWVPGMKSVDKVPVHPIWFAEQKEQLEALNNKPSAKRPRTTKANKKPVKKATVLPVKKIDLIPVSFAAAGKKTGARSAVKGFGATVSAKPAKRKTLRGK